MLSSSRESLLEAILKGNPRQTIMRIGIDAFPALETRGGIGTYVRHLLPALAALDSGDEFIAYVPGREAQRKAAFPQDLTQGVRYRPTNRTLLRWRGWLDGLDLYHGTNFKFQTYGRHGAVVTIHDLWLDRYPQRSRKLFGQRISRLRARRRLKNVAKVIADSRNTACDIQELYEVPPEKIVVIYPGTPSAFFDEPAPDRLSELRMRYHLDATPFMLFVGGADPRKNHRVLLEAFASLAETRKDVALVMVGDAEHRGLRISDTVRDHKLERQVRCVGSVPADDLRLLYAGAELFAFPSLYEGFGFPVLEAMACGTPVLTSNRTSLPEVAGDAALLVDPESAEEVTEGIRHILTDTSLRQSLRQKGVARAKEFNWETTARQTHAVYQDACHNA